MPVWQPTVYALVDPKDHQVHWIGTTTDGVHEPLRFSEQVSNAFRAWLADLAQRQHAYIVVALAVTDSYEKLDELEQHWIARGREFRWPLANDRMLEDLWTRRKLAEAAAVAAEAARNMAPDGTRWTLENWRNDPEVKAALRSNSRRK